MDSRTKMYRWIAAAISAKITVTTGSRSNTTALSGIYLLGGAEGTRTPDPHTASVVRYQLRHSPKLR